MEPLLVKQESITIQFGEEMSNAYTQLASEFDGWAQNNRAESMANGHWDVTIQMLDTIDITGISNMLDVGCGNGWLVRELLNRGVESGIGLDISPEMIVVANQANRFGERETYLVGNGEAIQIPDASIDCITNIESLYYYPKPEAALKEWARITKSGGQLAMMMDLYVENPATHNWIEALDVPVRLFAMHELQQLLEASGWTEVRMVQIQDRRPMKSRDDFVSSTYWPSYEQYVSYRQTGSLCITARRQ